MTAGSSGREFVISRLIGHESVVQRIDRAQAQLLPANGPTTAALPIGCRERSRSVQEQMLIWAKAKSRQTIAEVRLNSGGAESGAIDLLREIFLSHGSVLRGTGGGER